MDPLASARLKLERGRAHTDQLRLEIDAILGPDGGIRLVRRYDPDVSAVVYSIDGLPDIPRQWSVIIGDAVHNYRCALDHLWWRLAIKHLGREPTRREAGDIQFPIVRDSAQWAKHRFLKYVDPSDAAIVERAQPYHSRGATEPNGLEALGDLSNVDKHRELHLAVFVVANTEFRNEVIRWRDSEPLLDGSGRMQVTMLGVVAGRIGEEVFRIAVTATGRDPDVEFPVKVTGYVAIQETWNILAFLDSAGDGIAKILDRFAPLL